MDFASKALADSSRRNIIEVAESDDDDDDIQVIEPVAKSPQRQIKDEFGLPILRRTAEVGDMRANGHGPLTTDVARKVYPVTVFADQAFLVLLERHVVWQQENAAKRGDIAKFLNKMHQHSSKAVVNAIAKHLSVINSEVEDTDGDITHALLVCLFENYNVNEDWKSSSHYPVHWVARSGRVELMHGLRINGAEVDIRDYYDKTPLFHAASYGHVLMVKYLIECGAKLDVQVRFGRFYNIEYNYFSAMLYARCHEFTRLFFSLAQDDNGDTPLFAVLKIRSEQRERANAVLADTFYSGGNTLQHDLFDGKEGIDCVHAIVRILLNAGASLEAVNYTKMVLNLCSFFSLYYSNTTTIVL